jgi:PTS system ascorbate-specific IIB component
LDDEHIEATVDAADIGSVDPNSFDILITTSDFADTLRDSSAKIYNI